MPNHPSVIAAMKLALNELSLKSDDELREIFIKSDGDIAEFIRETGDFKDAS